jgi:hypothetical protein
MRSMSIENIRASITKLIRDRSRLRSTIIWLVIGILFLRSCILNSLNSLPSEVMSQIQDQYITCITFEDTPVWPGNTRQPECGTFEIKVVGKGTVSAQQKSEGITEAVCFEIQVQNPFWSTSGAGTTRHEIKQSSMRTSYQVAILQNGNWTTFPDQAQENEQRWADYSCPEP